MTDREILEKIKTFIDDDIKEYLTMEKMNAPQRTNIALGLLIGQLRRIKSYIEELEQTK